MNLAKPNQYAMIHIMYTGCMSELFFELLNNDPPPSNDTELTCNDNATSFIKNYNLTSANGELMSVFELRQLIGGFFEGLGGDICGDQLEFNSIAITRVLNLSETQKDYLLNQPQLLTEVATFLEEEGYHEDMSLALQMSVQMMIDLQMNDLLYSPNDPAYTDIINQYADNEMNPYISFLIAYEVASLKVDHPDWSDNKVYLKATFKVYLEQVHLLLDLGGLIPAAGEICDVTNGVIYTLEGDGINASFSFAAVMPIAGWWATSAKWANKIITSSTTGRKITLKFIKDGAGMIHFGSRSQLKTVIKPAANHQAHHIIPWQWKQHDVVQQVAKNGDPFHMNDVLNGIPMHKDVHNGSHPNYNAYVQDQLNDILSQAGGTIDPSVAATKVSELCASIRTAILNNPNTHINDLF